jgi:endonuclease/exonuclease/phosphatase (EEP) superfamily protein YafD
MSRASSPLRTLAGVLAIVAGAGALTGALLAQGGRFSPRLDVYAHFAPVWLLGAVLALGPGAILAGPRFRRPLLVVGVLGALAAGALMVPELRRAAPPSADAPSAPAGGRLRLIQYNAWAENPSPEAAADWIAAQKPDVVAVEELTPALRGALIGRGFRYRGGMTLEMGIFSRVPTSRPAVVVPLGEWPVLPEFARGVFPAPGGGGSFDLVAVHMVWPTGRGYGVHAEALARLLDLYHSDRLILAGDFNLTPWSFALRRLDHRLGMARADRALATWPARIDLGGRMIDTAPFLPIDHVFVGPAWRVLAVRRGPSLGSDHCPLVVDLALVRPGRGVFIAGAPARDRRT